MRPGDGPGLRKEGSFLNRGKYTIVSARCPFYRYQDTRSISCEGPYPRMGVKMCFPDPGQRDLWLRLHCKRDFGRCFLCALLSDLAENPGRTWDD